MTRTKFTSGPWRVVHGEDFVTVEAAKSPVAYLVRNGYVEEEILANAKLMAASGDLYFALLDLVNEFDLNSDDLDEWYLGELVSRARAALTKAVEGGE